MARRVLVCVLVLAGVMAAVWQVYLRRVTIRGSLATLAGVRSARVVLLQGSQAEPLFRMGMLAPGSELYVEGDVTIDYASVDAAGEFVFASARRRVDSVLVGFIEFANGRICQTSDVELRPTSDSDVELRPSYQKCWVR